MKAVWVSHTHWDREWYRTFQAFRARLVDAVDQVLELCAADPGFRFLLDGQAIVLEDYAEIRPGRVEELRARCVEGRIGIGPWYVQPDSLLPSGEAHVRNLLEGRRAAARFGPVSSVAYTPDSFGHPAQFPQLFAGFGLRAFVYWRGHGGEWDALPSEYDWVAPDGTALLACHLGRGYFSAASDVGSDLAEVVQQVAQTAQSLAERTDSGVILLMNGVDHMAPDPRAGELAAELSAATGLQVDRGLVDDFVEIVQATNPARPRFAGELVGARIAPLLPGVWSTRMWIKQANRACETALEGWAEPWSALGTALGLPDERPGLRLAWRELLQNQAHDSICGCSRDVVHEQMRPRFAAAGELASETTDRALERLAGLGAARRPPWSDELELAVFNPSPHRRTDRVRFAFDPHPYLVPSPDPTRMIHPMALHDLSGASFTADGRPARWLPDAGSERPALVADRPRQVLEFVAEDVPAFGWKRVSVRRAARLEACVEDVSRVEAGTPDASIEATGLQHPLRVQVDRNGTFRAEIEGRFFAGLAALEDVGDRGDSYDFDPVHPPGSRPRACRVELLEVVRTRSPAGIQELRVERELHVPVALTADREERKPQTTGLRVTTTIRLVSGVARIEVGIDGDNTARDHRLRALFPVAEGDARAATTFDVVRRGAAVTDDEGWVQKAPRTFAHQGFVHAGGLTVVAPGLPEAEWDGEAIAVTLLRSVGHLSRHDLRSRPGPAGPGIATPGAQVPGPFRAQLFLSGGCDPVAARDAELGLRAVPAGESPMLPPELPLLDLEPRTLVLSALKPPEDGDGLIVRVLNPTDRPETARLRLGVPLHERLVRASAVRLDETPTDARVVREGSLISFEVPPHALRTLRIR